MKCECVCRTEWFVGEILSLKDFPDFLIYAALRFCVCESVGELVGVCPICGKIKKESEPNK